MKAKALLITLLLSLSAVSLWAQEKYEFAILKKSSWGVFFKTENGTETLAVSKTDDKDTIQLKKLGELTAQGWEVFSVTESTESGTAVSYHLRRKKN